MKYWIFGGCGFVGRYLAQALRDKKEEVAICDIVASEPDYNVDIRDTEALANLPIAKEDVVINLAANQYHTKVPRNREEYFRSVNTEGTRNLLAMMEQKGCTRYIMFSTDMT